MTKKTEVLSTKKIAKDLLDIAYANKSFRNGTIGAFTLKANTEEPLDIIDTLETDNDWPTPSLAEGYSFTARRIPYIQDGQVKKYVNVLATYTIRMENAELPIHIAEDSYGLQGQEAIDNGGPSTIQQTVDVSYDTLDKHLGLHQEVLYTDADQDTISQTCTCQPPEIEEGFSVFSLIAKRTYEPQDDEDDDDDEYAPAEYKPITINTQFDVKAARKLETIDINNWSKQEILAIMDLQDDIEANKQDQDLKTARMVIQGMRKVFRSQLGMNI